MPGSDHAECASRPVKENDLPPSGRSEKDIKGHAQRLRCPDRNSAPNAKTIGSRNADVRENVTSTAPIALKIESR
jgi:hypothetical protein